MIAAHVPNLMDRSKFPGSVHFVGSADDVGDADLVLVDLDRCEELLQYAALPGRTVGFCAHVDDARMAAASAAGFDEVLPRSTFFRRLPDFLTGAWDAGSR